MRSIILLILYLLSLRSFAGEGGSKTVFCFGEKAILKLSSLEVIERLVSKNDELSEAQYEIRVGVAGYMGWFIAYSNDVSPSLDGWFLGERPLSFTPFLNYENKKGAKIKVKPSKSLSLSVIEPAQIQESEDGAERGERSFTAELKIELSQELADSDIALETSLRDILQCEWF